MNSPKRSRSPRRTRTRRRRRSSGSGSERCKWLRRCYRRHRFTKSPTLQLIGLASLLLSLLGLTFFFLTDPKFAPAPLCPDRDGPALLELVHRFSLYYSDRLEVCTSHNDYNHRFNPVLSSETWGHIDVSTMHASTKAAQWTWNDHRRIIAAQGFGQQEFDAGLKFLHAFDPFHAAVSFSQCLLWHEYAIMCLWGLYRSLLWDGGYVRAVAEAKRILEVAVEANWKPYNPHALFHLKNSSLSSLELTLLLQLDISNTKTKFCSKLLTGSYKETMMSMVEFTSLCAMQLVDASAGSFGHPDVGLRQLAQGTLQNLTRYCSVICCFHAHPDGMIQPHVHWYV